MVTIKDIAKIAGVSHTTVSRALNDSPLIKSATRQKIQAIAEELHYVPNVNARSLVNQKNYMIGLFFSSIRQGTSSNFLVDTITEIHSVLEEQYTLSVQGIDEIEHLEQINFQRYDGILVMSQSDSDQAFIMELKKQDLPFVVVNRDLNDTQITNVVADDKKGVQSAIEYGLSLGHRAIGYIGGRADFRSANERRAAVIETLEKKQVKIIPDFFVSGDYSLASGFQQMAVLLSQEERPTLVFCANDDMAIGAMRALHAQGLQIPDAISLIGFDDAPLTAYLEPPLTTVHKPLKKMTKIGIELLLGAIAGQPDLQKKVEIPTHLVKRQSVKNLNQ